MAIAKTAKAEQVKTIGRRVDTVRFYRSHLAQTTPVYHFSIYGRAPRRDGDLEALRASTRRGNACRKPLIAIWAEDDAV
jgi:hypothetical protein